MPGSCFKGLLCRQMFLIWQGCNASEPDRLESGWNSGLLVNPAPKTGAVDSRWFSCCLNDYKKYSRSYVFLQRLYVQTIFQVTFGPYFQAIFRKKMLTILENCAIIIRYFGRCSFAEVRRVYLWNIWKHSSAGMSVRLTRERSWVRAPLLPFCGALAQLGARNIRIVEAVGSNPICSILRKPSGIPEMLMDTGFPKVFQIYEYTVRILCFVERIQRKYHTW